MKWMMIAALVAAPVLGSPPDAMTSVCARTPQVRDFLVKAVNRSCELITEADLAGIKRVAVNNRKVAELHVGDFDGLPNLEIVNVVGNQLTTVPAGIFAKNPALKTIVIFDNPLRKLPDDFLEANAALENLHMFDVPLKTLSVSVIARLAAMKHLKVIDLALKLNPAERARLRALFPEKGQVELTFY